MPTLLQLRDRCKEESDNVGQSFVSDAEWNKRINNSYRECYGLLTEKFGADYFVKNPPQSITTDGVNQLFALATDFFKLLGVDVQITSPQQWVSLRPFAFADRNTGGFNSQIPAAGQAVRVWYVPRLVALAQDADATVDAFDINGWDEYIVVDAALVSVAKEESEVSVLMARKKALLERIDHEAGNRDAGNPSKIVDVFGRRSHSMRYRLSGGNLWLVGNATPGSYYDMGDWDAEDEQGFY